MTAPHGIAAWIAWGFGIASPVASLSVAAVAVYLGRTDQRRVRTREAAEALNRARLVSATIAGTRLDLPSRRAFGGLTLRNDSGQPVHSVTLVPYLGMRVLRLTGIVEWEITLQSADALQAFPKRISAPYLAKDTSATGDLTVRFALAAGTDAIPGRTTELITTGLRFVLRWTDASGTHWQRDTGGDPVVMAPTAPLSDASSHPSFEEFDALGEVAGSPHPPPP